MPDDTTKPSSEKRRLPRFHITPCQFLDHALGKAFAVQDISNGGLAIRLVDRADLSEFSVGMKRQGVIKIEGLKTECQVQVRFIKGSLIGAEWFNPTRELIEHLDEISSPEALGEHLKEYPLPEVDNTIWLHNPVGIDLILYKTEHPAQFYRWSLYLHQSFIQWDRDDELQTGRTVAEDDEGYSHGLVQLETRMIDYDAIPDQRLLESARTLIFAAMKAGKIQNEEALNLLKKSLE